MPAIATGRNAAVPICKLLGRAGQVAEESLEFARAFGQAVALFQERRWQDALDALQACRNHRPDDLATENYIEATALLQADPPADDWTGAIELTEK